MKFIFLFLVCFLFGQEPKEVKRYSVGGSDFRILEFESIFQLDQYVKQLIEVEKIGTNKEDPRKYLKESDLVLALKGPVCSTVDILVFAHQNENGLLFTCLKLQGRVRYGALIVGRDQTKRKVRLVVKIPPIFIATACPDKYGASFFKMEAPIFFG
jgi:hypothetical protein